VNDGVHQAVKEIQGVVGVLQDGRLGPATLAAIIQGDLTRVADQLRGAQEQFYRGVVARIPARAKDLNGWVKRARAVYPDLPA
jgi:lysozyme family protein